MSAAKATTGLDSANAIYRFLHGSAAASAWTPSPTIRKVTPVKGGSTNHTFRLHFHKPLEAIGVAGESFPPKSAIFKYFPDNILLTPEISFSSRRQAFEARALTDLAKHLDSAPRNGVQISLPKLLHADLDEHFIIVEDLSPERDLGHLNSRSSINCAQFVGQVGTDPFKARAAVNVARALGTWLFSLHSLGRNMRLGLHSRFDHFESRKIQDLTTLGDFIRCIELCGVQLESERKRQLHAILKQHGDELVRSGDGGTLVMGDFWMGNFMIRLTGGGEMERSNGPGLRAEPSQVTEDTGSTFDVSSEPKLLVHVIDWEFTTYALPYIDLAHFAAEAWLFDFFRRQSVGVSTISRTMTAALFDSYSQAGGTINLDKVIVYIAGHIGCFLHYTDHWTKDQGLKIAACMQAVRMIENAAAQRWD
ncbi:hypothetical protein AYL99_09074 [Fonsecaea erecta]|uniref:Aminoglycoside phosphotransferase domain-containing protein n=1 Tax=Fonsecaea erecta TaxID=1367422 RepID=A0A178ZBC6_9EURO|nr:hypothetical protein AYL99_09074 [Fonsecaea erecta]OAP56962.1 hypothetical protein AYL99_09074 [Fonsecaea erecta]